MPCEPGGGQRRAHGRAGCCGGQGCSRADPEASAALRTQQEGKRGALPARLPGRQALTAGPHFAGQLRHSPAPADAVPGEGHACVGGCWVVCVVGAVCVCGRARLQESDVTQARGAASLCVPPLTRHVHAPLQLHPHTILQEHATTGRRQPDAPGAHPTPQARPQRRRSLPPPTDLAGGGRQRIQLVAAGAAAAVPEEPALLVVPHKAAHLQRRQQRKQRRPQPPPRAHHAPLLSWAWCAAQLDVLVRAEWPGGVKRGKGPGRGLARGPAVRPPRGCRRPLRPRRPLRRRGRSGRRLGWRWRRAAAAERPALLSQRPLQHAGAAGAGRGGRTAEELEARGPLHLDVVCAGREGAENGRRECQERQGRALASAQRVAAAAGAPTAGMMLLQQLLLLGISARAAGWYT
jgi:hypothetical protein